VLGVVYVLVALLAPRGLVGFVRDLHAKKAGP
jgi:ABC-type branched-subunit amino acid transport system permease subunit